MCGIWVNFTCCPHTRLTHIYVSLFLFLVGLFAQVIGMMQDYPSLLEAAKVGRPNVTAFAFMSSSVNPVLYVFTGSSHIRQAGLGFMAKLFEGTNSESVSSRTRSSRGSNAESSVFTKLSVKLSRKGDGTRAETLGGEEESRADMHNRDERKTLTTLH